MGVYVFRILVLLGFLYAASQSWLLAAFALMVAGGMFGARHQEHDEDEGLELPANARPLGLHGFSEEELLQSCNPGYWSGPYSTDKELYPLYPEDGDG